MSHKADFSSARTMCGLVLFRCKCGEMERLGYLRDVSWLMLVSQRRVAAPAVGCFSKSSLYTHCYKRAALHEVRLKLGE